MTQGTDKFRICAQVELSKHDVITHACKNLHERAGLTDRNESASKPSNSRDVMPQQAIRTMIHERDASNLVLCLTLPAQKDSSGTTQSHRRRMGKRMGRKLSNWPSVDERH